MIPNDFARWRDGDTVSLHAGARTLTGTVICWTRAEDGEAFLKVKLSAPAERVGDIIWPHRGEPWQFGTGPYEERCRNCNDLFWTAQVQDPLCPACDRIGEGSFA